MVFTRDPAQLDRRLIARSAAAMYAGAAAVGLIEDAIPGGQQSSAVPGLVALGVLPFLWFFGPRLPRVVLATLGPIGVALVAVAVGTSPRPGDGAVLYLWPVLWSAFFFGATGMLCAIVSVGVAHAAALWALPAASRYPDRWLDVMTSVVVVAVVVRMLARRNDRLLVRLANEARTDPLTGLLNRRGLNELVSFELARLRRDESSLAVALVDIDHFKQVNDQWGHDTGDRLLVHLASVLRSRSREMDLVARIGGEEFLVLLPNASSAAADLFTQRVRSALDEEAPPGLPPIRISAGVAEEVAPGDLDALLQRADSALYHAKQTGRDRTVDLGTVQNFSFVE